MSSLICLKRTINTVYLLISTCILGSSSIHPDKRVGIMQYFSMISLLCIVCTACFDSTFEPLPCGGPNICSEPRVCVENQCVFACYQDADCDANEICERQVCVSNKLAQTDRERIMGDMALTDMSLTDMSPESDGDAGHTDMIIP